MSVGKLSHVSQETIAKMAGVARSSVSMALRNHPEISPETCQRVQAIAQKLGYHPSPLASMVMSQIRSSRNLSEIGTIGFITFATPGTKRYNVVSKMFLEGVMQATQKVGLKVEPFWIKHSRISAKALNRILYHKRISAVIIDEFAGVYRADRLRKGLGHISLDFTNLTAVIRGYSLARPTLHRVCSDYSQSMHLAIRQLRRLGYKKIGFVVKQTQSRRLEHLWLGAFNAFQLHVKPDCQIPVLMPETWNEVRFRAWFSQFQPEVIISTHPEVLSWIFNLELSVPTDVGWVHQNVTAYPGESWSGIDQQWGEFGAATVELLLAQMQRKERGIPGVPKTVLLPGKWVPGTTVRKIPRSHRRK
jgi:LacI family transcriptional regulator